ncbi:MAG: hypothetical protein GX892_03820 [Thermoanaerobacteraceae bacterium]|nr:hypothetical protein [Thermoanaerobacteraceae bacterium]
MTYYNDPYGVGRLKARKILEREKSQKKDFIAEQIATELKSISKRLQVLQGKL